MAEMDLKPASWEKGAVLGLVALGTLARLVWAANPLRLTPFPSESHYVALSLAKTGHFADPFGFASGPTAHLGMLTPLPSAFAYWLFGDSRSAEYLLSVWAALLVALAIWLCWRLLLKLDAPRPARIAATAFVALVPLQFILELREGRNWEVNLAAVLLIWILCRLVNGETRGTSLFLTGALAGLLFILSPPAGLAATLSLSLFLIWQLPVSRWWMAPLGFALVAGLLAGLWAERNLDAMGEPILLRDNIDLELAVSNYPGALHSKNPGPDYMARLKTIHPIQMADGAGVLRRAGGEIAYYRAQGREARSWITRNPGDFLILCLRHFRAFFLPPRWFWSPYGTPVNFVGVRQALSWAGALLGLGTLIVMARRKRAYAYILVAVLTSSLPYIVVQPTLRYRYLVSTLLLFLAFDGIGRLNAKFGKAPPWQGPH